MLYTTSCFRFDTLAFFLLVCQHFPAKTFLANPVLYMLRKFPSDICAVCINDFIAFVKQSQKFIAVVDVRRCYGVFRDQLAVGIHLGMIFEFFASIFRDSQLIQEWLGHSDISTTMNIYAHLDTTAKDASAAAMSQALSLPDWGGGYGWQRAE